MNDNVYQHSDSELIELTLDGQRDAFGVLVRKYQDRLFNGMVHVLRSEAEAEDTVQEAFILALTKLNTFKGNSQFFTWLYRIAYNVAVTRMRRRKPTVSIESQEPELRFQVPDDRPLPEAALVEHERAGQLMKALGKLSDEYRSILLLREMEEMDYSAISEVLELPIGTVRSRLHRARLQLKEILESTIGSDG